MHTGSGVVTRQLYKNVCVPLREEFPSNACGVKKGQFCCFVRVKVQFYYVFASENPATCLETTLIKSQNNKAECRQLLAHLKGAHALVLFFTKEVLKRRAKPIA